MYNNTNKRSVTLNLEKSAGQNIFKKLCQHSDIIIETFPARYMASLGLDYPNLNKINPSLIMASVTGFGQTGPNKDFKSSPIICEAMGGIMFMTGSPDKSPLQQGHLITCYVVSMFTAVAILTALYYRNFTGIGQQIDISMQECMASIQELTPWSFHWGVDSVKRSGGPPHRATSAPVDIYRCKDGYFWPFILGPERWDRLISWIIQDGINVDEFANPEYEAAEKRVAEQDKIGAIISQWGKLHTKNEIFEEAVRRELPVAPVRTIAELTEDSQLNCRGFFKDVDHPVIGRIKYPQPPYPLEGVSRKIKPAPSIGQHNIQVYKEIGFSKEDILILKGTRVI
jgi:crotonobetainyl-CoA:carnitine CoA-transferase CaiB-like acyl-CoA transferase